MIKLGIFGDSFADDTGLWVPGKFENVGPSWIDHLRLTGKYEIENFALGGSSTYYSKRLFDQHYDRFDQIIFVATFPNGRLEISNFEKYVENLPKQFFNVSSVLDAEKNIHKFNSFEKILLNALKQYYVYLQDDFYDSTVHSIMLEDAQIKFPNIVFIPGFAPSVPWLESDPMIKIAQKEQAFFNLNDSIPNAEDLYDARKCHMCEENHEIFAKKVLEFLDGAPVKLNINDFVNPTREKSHYFRKRPW